MDHQNIENTSTYHISRTCTLIADTKKCNLMLAISPTSSLRNYLTYLLTQFFFKSVVNTFRDMNYFLLFLVKRFFSCGGGKNKNKHLLASCRRKILSYFQEKPRAKYGVQLNAGVLLLWCT